MSTEAMPAPPRTRGPLLAAWAGLALCLAAILLLVARSAQGSPRGLFGPVLAWLTGQPFVLLFITVAAGYGLGGLRVRRFSLGATAGTLVFGLGLSLWASLRGVAFALPEFASTVFFNLFMFAVGMKVGPQFLSGLRRDARAFIALGLFVPLLSAALMFALAALFHLKPGLAPGILAGANTATGGLGAASDVFRAEGRGGAAAGNLSAAFALSYGVSLVLFVLLMKGLPRLFGRDARREAQALQREIERGRGQPLPGTARSLLPATAPLEVRVFRVESPALAGVTLDELKRRFPGVAIERVQRQDESLELVDALELAPGDVVALSGSLASMVNAGRVIGPEEPDEALRSVGLQTVEVVAGDRAAGRSVRELLTAGHGFHLNALFRAGTEIPAGPGTAVEKGDVLRVTASELRVGQLEAALGGRVVRPSIATDIATLALGLSVGAVLGTIRLPIPGLKLSLGSAVGLLVTGIVLSTLRTRNPLLGGPFPEPARQLLEDLGLNVFIAITALNAGAGAIAAVHGGALVPIAVGTLVCGLLPAVAGWALGQYRHHMNAGLLAGAVTGARCSSAGLRVAQEETGSTVPALSYPVTFAIANVVVTLCCYLLATLD